MKPQIIYIYDAYCAWSYAFSPVVLELKNRYEKEYDFDVYSGGLITPKKPAAMELFAAHYKHLEKEIPVKYGTDFLWHIENPGLTDWFPDSRKPATALAVFRNYLPEKQVEFALDLGTSLFLEGRDLCDDEAYRHLLSKYDLPEKEFYKRLHEEEYIHQAEEDFEIVKQLAPGGYPSLLVQTAQNKFRQLAIGYTPIEQIVNILQQKTPE